MSNKMSVLVSSGDREQLQMAAMISSVAAVSGNEVNIFLSMNSLRYFQQGDTNVAPSEGEVGALLQNKSVPDFRDLFRSAVELGDAQIYPCSMALDILNIPASGLLDYITPEPLGLTRFLDMSSDSQVLSF